MHQKPQNKSNQPKPIEISSELKERLERKRRASDVNIGYEVTEEQVQIAEFGQYYGWGGVMAILNNEIDTSTFQWLLQAARKNKARQLYENMNGTYLATLAVKTDTPEKYFEKFTKQYKDNMKADL